MSYTITITGHKEAADAEQSREHAEAVAAVARELLSRLEGVTSAVLITYPLGVIDLLHAE